ncbi:GNAT family N-acetyltransferase [Actinoplanes sp. TFC3]|uniref:GNAT family N-acetyltransferase n=1 Tax=Actinoplanes sp. TFC3 TaxID=1710355 RepID=UPI000835F762|nr:GNAT family N-acetyltransferase [Actinoplanes sp. TFC3]
MSIEVRTLSAIADLEAVDRVLGAVWQGEPVPLLGTELLRALAKAGNYIAGAYDGGELLGGCVAFFGPPGERELHSHVTGVARAAIGRSIGYALKQHQLGWARDRGAAAITWTVDPLVARNAYFNLAKLGAEPVEYLSDFYGPMHDRINGDDPSDRLLMRWDVARAATPRPGTPDPIGPHAVVALDRDLRRGPLTGEQVLVAVPEDIEVVRTTDPAAARRWRLAVREVLAGLLAEGAQVTGFDRAAGYVLRRPQ